MAAAPFIGLGDRGGRVLRHDPSEVEMRNPNFTTSLNSWIATALTAIFLLSSQTATAEDLLDFRTAVVVASERPSKVEATAIQMLIQEVEKRTGLTWERFSGPAERNLPQIVVGRLDVIRNWNLPIELPAASGERAKEGYSIRIANQTQNPVVVVAGNDDRGVLFGVGHLLRAMWMSRGRAAVPADLKITTAPYYALRGHQLGYRPKPNSYDGWDLEMWEQYIRDLVVFGTNAIELIPPKSDDEETSPHFPLPQMETMVGMSAICERYGLDVWVWYPALEEDYTDAATMKRALEEWGGVFEKLPRLDAVFVPCGDPGATPPEVLMPMLQQQARQLKEWHPKATWWIAPQGFNARRLAKFKMLIDPKPDWLEGLVYGPQMRMSLPEFRKWAPSHYPVRHYPDITHSNYCQLPVPNWDPAFALTEGREVINPRPLDMAHIFRLLQPQTNGFLSYSEGCNDDVNKFIWSSLGWDPESDVVEILRQYSRYFIDPELQDSFAQGLLALERNWSGPIGVNGQIDTTLRQFQALERSADSSLMENWRFQQALFRAYCDVYVRRRAIYEAYLEDQTLDILGRASTLGVRTAIGRALAMLRRSVTDPVAVDHRKRIFELADALFQSVRMQLDTPTYQATRQDGAVLDRIDAPLNNRGWLEERLMAINKMTDERQQLADIAEIVDWKNPGPGGFYDNLGVPGEQPHLVSGLGWPQDPSGYATPILTNDFNIAVRPVRKTRELPMSWISNAIGLYDNPLKLQYRHLDPSARYQVRYVHARRGPVRLVADDQEVHPLQSMPYQILEFDVPHSATADGELTLFWHQQSGGGGNGWENNICEVWLLKR